MAFVFTRSLVIPCLPELMATYSKVCTKLEVILWRNMRKFSWRDKFIFLLVSGSIWFFSFSRLNIFTSKISNLQDFKIIFSGRKGPESWILIYQVSVAVGIGFLDLFILWVWRLWTSSQWRHQSLKCYY